jgi:hypothetical protein
MLGRDDPLLAPRFRRRQRRERRNDVIVFSLLVLSVILLAAALATNGWACWLAGAAAFLASFAVDNRYNGGRPVRSARQHGFPLQTTPRTRVDDIAGAG